MGSMYNYIFGYKYRYEMFMGIIMQVEKYREVTTNNEKKKNGVCACGRC